MRIKLLNMKGVSPRMVLRGKGRVSESIPKKKKDKDQKGVVK